MLRTVMLSALVLNIGLILGRISGFGRDAVIASVFGATSEADIVVLMLTIPDLLVNILVGGAMGAALLPAFSANAKNAKQLLFQTAVFLGVVFTLFSFFLYWQSYYLVDLFAPGFSDIKKEQASEVIAWVVWLIPLTVMSGAVTAYLHFRGKFGIASLGTLIVNTFIIVGLLCVYYGFGTLFWIASFVILGGGVRLLSQVFSVRLSWRPLKALSPVRLDKPLLTSYFQALASSSFLLLIPVLARMFSSYSMEGSLAIMNYAIRLVEFPLAIAITVLSVVLFPRLADSFVNNQPLHHRLVRYGSQAILVISLLITCSLILLGQHYVDIVYNYGEMDEVSLNKVKELALIGLIALPFQGLSVYFTAIFYSRGEHRAPLFINAFGLVVFIFICLQELFGSGLDSIVWGVVASYVFTVLVQFTVLKFKGIIRLNFFINLEFILGGSVAFCLLYLLTQLTLAANLSTLTTLFLGMIIGLLSLLVFSGFNQEIRALVKKRF